MDASCTLPDWGWGLNPQPRYAPLTGHGTRKPLVCRPTHRPARAAEPLFLQTSFSSEKWDQCLFWRMGVQLGGKVPSPDPASPWEQLLFQPQHWLAPPTHSGQMPARALPAVTRGPAQGASLTEGRVCRLQLRQAALDAPESRVVGPLHVLKHKHSEPSRGGGAPTGEGAARSQACAPSWNTGCFLGSRKAGLGCSQRRD